MNLTDNEQYSVFNCRGAVKWYWIEGIYLVDPNHIEEFLATHPSAGVLFSYKTPALP